jgi:hypothetical protein
VWHGQEWLEQAIVSVAKKLTSCLAGPSPKLTWMEVEEESLVQMQSKVCSFYANKSKSIEIFAQGKLVTEKKLNTHELLEFLCF